MSRMALARPGVAASMVVALAMLVTAACEQKSVEEVETTAAVPVAVATASTQTLQATIAATGVVTVAPGAERVVVAPEAARIAELPHAEGDTVKAGDVLVRFEIPSLGADLAARRAVVAQDAARLEAARASFSRLSALLAQGVAAPREVEDARRLQAEVEADLEQARAAVDAATSLSERTVVRAPFAGVIARRFHNPGDVVEAAASDPVLRLIDPSKLQVTAAVPVSELSRVIVGRAARVREPGHDTLIAASVLVKPPQIDPASATAEVRLAFKAPTMLTAGTPVEIEIVAEERRNALVIPAAALVDDDGDVFVMVAGDDGKAHKFPVAVGLSTRTQVQVTSGLKPGDRVIVRGQDGLPEGAVVTIQSP